LPDTEARKTEPIAIVGAGCLLPGKISTLQDLFAALEGGRDCITGVPPDRWEVDSYYDPDPVAPGKTYVRHGGFVSGIDCFDPAFFGISGAEASRMDPQQRMALETVWHALEDAGQSAGELAGSNTGVFLAMMNTNGYALLKGAREGFDGITGYDALGDAMSITAGRISHFLDLAGPCMAVDTACSGSLVAVHLARQSILAGDCSAALVVGVSAILHPGIHMAFSKLGLMSRSGRCKAFDESADGYIRGEGCVAVLLRRETEAIARGDRILASIVGTAINQDGHTPALTAPNAGAQEKVMRMALARSGVSPFEVGYVEAHGTGTPVGDPIEMSALANVYGAGRSPGDPLYTGSAKSNFGHLESGAGLLGLLKAALSLDRGVIFPSLHFRRWNPNIHLGDAAICVPTAPIPWPRGETARVAGVNSFSYSGTNAHALLREAPLDAGSGATVAARPAELLVLSARSAASLQELADRWSDFLARDDSPPLRDISFTAAAGRTHMRHRLAIVGRGKEEIREKLARWRNGSVPKGLASGQAVSGHPPKVVFVFSGQGNQYAEMGRQLDETEPEFRAAINRCGSLMDAKLGVPLRDVLFGRSSHEWLTNTRYAQPALFAIQYALVELLAHWGVCPDFVVGHGTGEIGAACSAAVLDLEAASELITARGRLMAGLPRGGKMLAVEATLDEVRASLDGGETDFALAAVNGPRSVVISGRAQAVNAAAQMAAAAGRRTRELAPSPAFHSPLMDPIVEELNAVARSLRMSRAEIPMASCLTGTFLDGDLDAGYWSSQARQPVLFYQAMRAIVDAGGSLLMEIGPHPALTPEIAAAFSSSRLIAAPTLTRDRQDTADIFETLSRVYANGGPLDLNRLYPKSGYRRVAVPLYPFRRDRYWIGAAAPPESRTPAPATLHPLLGRAIAAEAGQRIFESSLSTTYPWVDHRVLGATVFPGAAYLELVARGFAATRGEDWAPVVIKDVAFERPLLLDYGKPAKLRLTLVPDPSRSDEVGFTITADAGGGGTCCRGRVGPPDAGCEPTAKIVESQKGPEMQVGRFYGELREEGLEYGASFSTVRGLWLGQPESGEATGRITASPDPDDPQPHPFTNTVLLDGSLQVSGAALRTLGGSRRPGAFVPVSIRSVVLWRPMPLQVWSDVRARTNHDGQAAVASIRILDDSGETVADFDGVELRLKSSLLPAKKQDMPAAAPETPHAALSRAQLVQWLRGLPNGERSHGMAEWLSSEVKTVLGKSADEIDLEHLDPSAAFLEIGLDSLSLTELQRRIQEKLEFRFQPMQDLDYQSIESLAEYLLNEVLLVESA
jgi:acyl transferase domain-containing protein